jgi:hypothetical protein
VIPVIDTALAEALFISNLQPSQRPTADQVVAAINSCLHAHGATGCAAATAAEYGDHPDTAPTRMRWALQLCEVVGACPAAERSDSTDPGRPADRYESHALAA